MNEMYQTIINIIGWTIFISIPTFWFGSLLYVIFYTTKYTEDNIEKELEAWRRLCDPLDKLISEYNYFKLHGYFQEEKEMPIPLFPKVVIDEEKVPVFSHGKHCLLSFTSNKPPIDFPHVLYDTYLTSSGDEIKIVNVGNVRTMYENGLRVW